MKRKQKRNRQLLIVVLIIFLLSVGTIYSFFRIRKLEQQKESIGIIISEITPEIEFYRSLIPIRRLDIPFPPIRASASLVAIMSDDRDKFLFEENSDVVLPIASIAKLMTAIIAIEQYNLDDELLISEGAFLKDLHRPNNLFPGETYSVRSLLYASLIESSNSAAQSLAEGKTFLDFNSKETSFINKMNERARSLGMRNTRFSNPTGLDPLIAGSPINQSSARDLLILARYLLSHPLILEILSVESYTLMSADGMIKYEVISTNEFLRKRDDIIGGKTGRTVRAGGSFFGLFKRGTSYIFTIILNSRDRFSETEKMLEWIEEAYYWGDDSNIKY